MNVPTLIVLALVAAALAAIIYGQIRRKKQGKSSCSCGGSCGACPMSGSCHGDGIRKK